MEVTGKTQDELLILLSWDEADTLKHALNEVCNGINWSDGEFITRMGVPRSQALDLLRAITNALRS